LIFLTFSTLRRDGAPHGPALRHRKADRDCDRESGGYAWCHDGPFQCFAGLCDRRFFDLDLDLAGTFERECHDERVVGAEMTLHAGQQDVRIVALQDQLFARLGFE
jgi:hypothetical protein